MTRLEPKEKGNIEREFPFEGNFIEVWNRTDKAIRLYYTARGIEISSIEQPMIVVSRESTIESKELRTDE